MSIALERSNSGTDKSIERPGFVHRNMTCASSIYNSPEFSAAADRRVPPVEEEDRSASLSSSSTSSIGNNSDESSGGGGGGGGKGEEVQSEYKEGALDSLDALEEVLPVKKSISKFYCGKSKSFTSLSDAASYSSMKDITKPENGYSKKRKNLMAYKYFWDKNSNNNTRNSHGGISKRPNNSRSMLALAAISNCGESNNGETSNSTSSPGCTLPPLPPSARRTIWSELSSSPHTDKFSSWRSFSLSDLQGAAAETSSHGIPGLLDR